jgi:uncharacterized membrane protein YraQ (UPF0718 family)
MSTADFLLQLLQGGLGNLAAYLAAHVLLCLVPAFYIAGAMTALIPKDSVTRFLGRNTSKAVSYPAAALAGSVLAVCSCTIVPLFAGIYKKGAGLGPAITFLFFAPAANILALVYTGGVIGADLAFARLFLSLVFGIGIGLIMALVFRRSDIAHDKATDEMFAGQGRKGMHRAALVFLLILVALLLSGTLKVGLLTNSYIQATVPIPGVDRIQDFLHNLVPFDAAKGEEGVTAQGAILIGMLALIGFASWKGMENIHEGFTYWTWIALGLVGFTLLTASLGMQPLSGGLEILFTGKFFGVLAALIVLGWLLRKRISEAEQRDFLWESWRFVKQIFPLLVVGVFTVGVIRVLIQPEWIEALAGQNSLLGNLAGVIFGVFMYFPTLVEVPIAKMFLGLGMHRGPLLAYLMADPELSLQSILITAAIIGRLKAWVYVFWVALFSTLAGLIYGAWVDGTSPWFLALNLGIFLALLALGLFLVNRRNITTTAGQQPASAD